MEFWGPCTLHIRTEFSPAGKMLRSVNGVAFPKGGSLESKAAFREFRESIEFLRVLFGSSRNSDTPFLSSFLEVLSLHEQFSFHNAREQFVWIGSDATLSLCATIDFNNLLYTRFSPWRHAKCNAARRDHGLIWRAYHFDY